MTSCIAPAAGIDISKDHLDAAVHPGQHTRRFTNDRTGHTALLRWLERSGAQRIVFEATGPYHRTLERRLAQAGLAFAKVNPRQARRFAEATGTLAKTDRIDAMGLARFAALLQPECRPPRSATLDQLAELIAARRMLIKDRTATTNRQDADHRPAQAPGRIPPQAHCPPARCPRCASAPPGRIRSPARTPTGHPDQHSRARRGHRDRADRRYARARPDRRQTGRFAGRPGTRCTPVRNLARQEFHPRRPGASAPSALHACSRRRPVQSRPQAAIRLAYQEGGELAGIVELRRHFPVIADNAHARLCVRAIAGWAPIPDPDHAEPGHQ